MYEDKTPEAIKAEILAAIRIGLVNETNQVILHGSFMFHVEIKLAVHGF